MLQENIELKELNLFHFAVKKIRQSENIETARKVFAAANRQITDKHLKTNLHYKMFCKRYNLQKKPVTELKANNNF